MKLFFFGGGGDRDGRAAVKCCKFLNWPYADQSPILGYVISHNGSKRGNVSGNKFRISATP